jgi:hypothetical protein
MRPADERVVAVAIRRYGAVLDLRAQPETLIDLLRRFGPAVSAEPVSRRRRARRRVGRIVRTARGRFRQRLSRGLRRRRASLPAPPAGTPLPGVQPTNAEVMREVLALARTVEELRRELVAPGG